MDNDTLTLTAEQATDIRVALIQLNTMAKWHNYDDVRDSARRLYVMLMNEQYGDAGLDWDDYGM